MISCSDFIAEIGNLVDDGVAAELRIRLEAHLSHCQTCQVIYDSARKTLHIVTESGCFELPEAASAPIAERIMSKIRGESSGGSKKR